MSEAPPSNAAPNAEPIVEPHDFRNSSLLSQRQLRKLRAHETQFLGAMAARIALFIRSDFPAKIGSIQICTLQKLTSECPGPTHLVLFKTEPLRGVSVLEIPQMLALTLVDRMMGGPGRVDNANRETSEIERALLDQIVQIILEEWCNNWSIVKPLKASALGCESSGRFVQIATPQTTMLVLNIDARLGDCAGQIKMAFPYSTLEPHLRQLCGGADPDFEAPTSTPAGPVKWNRGLDDVTLPVIAEWQGLELSARDVLHLKTGDVLQIPPQLAQQVSLRMGELSKFSGRLGTIAGLWAVELTQAAKA